MEPQTQKNLTLMRGTWAWFEDSYIIADVDTEKTLYQAKTVGFLPPQIVVYSAEGDKNLIQFSIQCCKLWPLTYEVVDQQNSMIGHLVQESIFAQRWRITDAKSTTVSYLQSSSWLFPGEFLLYLEKDAIGSLKRGHSSFIPARLHYSSELVREMNEKLIVSAFLVALSASTGSGGG